MANTYTTNYNLAKPAHGDVNWHIPINKNWDKIDTELDNAAKTALVSELTVDADKNWNGKNINNVNMLTVNKIKATSYLWTTDPGLTKPRYINNTFVSNNTTSWVTVKTTPTAKIGVLGTATIYYNISAANCQGGIRLLKNDVVVPKSEFTVYDGIGSLAIDVSITTGDVFKLQIKSYKSSYACVNNEFGIYALMTPIIDETETWS